MPPRPRRSSSRRLGSARRRTAWAQSFGSLTFTANGQWTNADLLQTYKASTGASAVGATVLHTFIRVIPRVHAANDKWWVGLMVGDLNDIVVAGTGQNNALVPNPHDNPYLDWMLAKQMEFDSNGFLDGSVNMGGSMYGGFQASLKSRRRMHQVQMTYTLTVYQEQVGTVAATYDWFARTLIALPL